MLKGLRMVPTMQYALVNASSSYSHFTGTEMKFNQFKGFKAIQFSNNGER